MAVYWCTEALPLAVTGLMPVVFLPLFGILSTGDVCDNYLRDVSVMSTGGLIVALGLESSGLHRRLALRVLTLCGTSKRW